MKKQTKPLSRKAKLVEIYCDALAGVKYADAQMADCRAGDHVQLVWERSNPHDSNAIKVMYGIYKIGYIKREHTRQLHSFREKGIKLHTWIRGIYSANPSWESIYIVVKARSIFNTDRDEAL